MLIRSALVFASIILSQLILSRSSCAADGPKPFLAHVCLGDRLASIVASSLEIAQLPSGPVCGRHGTDLATHKCLFYYPAPIMSFAADSGIVWANDDAKGEFAQDSMPANVLVSLSQAIVVGRKGLKAILNHGEHYCTEVVVVPFYQRDGQNIDGVFAMPVFDASIGRSELRVVMIRRYFLGMSTSDADLRGVLVAARKRFGFAVDQTRQSSGSPFSRESISRGYDITVAISPKVGDTDVPVLELQSLLAFSPVNNSLRNDSVCALPTTDVPPIE